RVVRLFGPARQDRSSPVGRVFLLDLHEDFHGPGSDVVRNLHMQLVVLVHVSSQFNRLHVPVSRSGSPLLHAVGHAPLLSRWTGDGYSVSPEITNSPARVGTPG